MNIYREQVNKLRLELIGLDAEEFSILENLIEEANQLYHLVSKHDKEYWRRSYVRSVFTFIEGATFSFKQRLFKEAELRETELLYKKMHIEISRPIAKENVDDIVLEPSLNLTRAEIAFLLEESYQLTEQGEVTTRPNYGVRIGQNLRFVWKMVERIYGISTGFDAGGSEWYSFQEALKVRNRITHPKSLSDLTVSDDDLNYVVKTFEWLRAMFLDTTLQYFKTSIEENKEVSEKMT